MPSVYYIYDRAARHGSRPGEEENMTVLDKAAPYVVEQDYFAYTFDKHRVWSDLARPLRLRELGKLACREYWEGYDAIGLKDDACPCSLKFRHAFGTAAVGSRFPSRDFFRAMPSLKMLAARMFPTTIWRRDRDSIDYTPEPDIFHDVFGRLPMYANTTLADFLERYGATCSHIEDPGLLERLGRLFWHTVEFGLVVEDGEIHAYGSGILSSRLESGNIREGGCEIQPLDLDQVLLAPVKVDEIHKALFAIDTFDQVHKALDEAHRRIEKTVPEKRK
jgi:phenylalanine-4-hydroxylase